MIFRDKDIKTIRTCQLHWHCTEIVISQNKLEDGYELSGYGIIKINEIGKLYLEFICLKVNKPFDFNSPIPKDPFDSRQELTMTAKSIDGLEITSSGLRIEANFQQLINGGSDIFHLGLEKIQFEDNSNLQYKSEKSLYLEFNEVCRIPKNKLNKSKSTLGKQTSSWNQTNLTYNNFRVEIIRHDKFTSVFSYGDGIGLSAIKDAIIFYLGFSSGVYIQPYYEIERNSLNSVTKIISIDREKIDRRIPQPIPELLHDENNKSLEQLHFDLFPKILDAMLENNNRFVSIYSQWKRIWHSFMSPEISVSMLTISVAIEGVLNDIFIPVIAQNSSNSKFENEKNKIIYQLKSVDFISGEHKSTLENFINNWGSIHPKKALEYLSEQGVIDKKQIKIWSKLRNSSAHPKLVRQDENRRKQDLVHIISCLSLFYRLSLNVFSYQGGQYAYEKLKDDRILMTRHVDVLNSHLKNK